MNPPPGPLAPLRWVPGILFCSQIFFLGWSQHISGDDNLKIYGEIGNKYIIARTDRSPTSTQTLLERFAVTQEGQQIWLNNVFRDIDNGAPVKPPITSPLPHYKLKILP
ncbi:hypothetical protein TeGR_g9617 [Tetraparma gracilis]|uniref:Uncharacterized protein n=1 Tax=Tetraparma gracilis TaxID=2962635 RepID=A0ABQ6MRY9_9STRA|nr:hypothetical protein TeGR_g9617 [Tetraparma gracilis]